MSQLQNLFNLIRRNDTENVFIQKAFFFLLLLDKCHRSKTGLRKVNDAV